MAPVSVLDVEASDLDRRVGLCLGSADEVHVQWVAGSGQEV